MLNAEENILLPLAIAGEKPEPAFFEAARHSRSASATGSRTGRRSSRVASSSASRSRARSSRSPTSCSPTSRPATSTRRRASEILELLRHSVEDLGQTIVMVTHEARAAAIADRVLFLADGRIVRELSGATQHEIGEAMEEIAAR